MAIMHLLRIFGSRQRHRKSTVMKDLPEDFYRQCTRLQSYIVFTFLAYRLPVYYNLFVRDMTRTLSFRAPDELTVGDFK